MSLVAKIRSVALNTYKKYRQIYIILYLCIPRKDLLNMDSHQ